MLFYKNQREHMNGKLEKYLGKDWCEADHHFCDHPLAPYFTSQHDQYHPADLYFFLFNGPADHPAYR